MKRFPIFALALVASSLGACSYKETVHQPAPAPAGTVVATPAPAGSAVVYTQPAPATTTIYTTR